jgi:glucan phosphoethanolaminetransferase (alkaline phosphatase superfamily)
VIHNLSATGRQLGVREMRTFICVAAIIVFGGLGSLFGYGYSVVDHNLIHNIGDYNRNLTGEIILVCLMIICMAMMFMAAMQCSDRPQYNGVY